MMLYGLLCRVYLELASMYLHNPRVISFFQMSHHALEEFSCTNSCINNPNKLRWVPLQAQVFGFYLIQYLIQKIFL